MAHNSAAKNTQQKIKIRNKQGETLVGLLHETGSNEIVVLCHGFLCSKDTRIILNLALALEKARFAAFRFDFSGNGESEGEFQFGNFCQETEDLRAVVEYFTEANRKTVALVGHSKAGNIVLKYASEYHDIDAIIVNLSGRFYVYRGIEGTLGSNFMEKITQNGFIDFTYRGNLYRATRESVMERVNMNMRDICLSIDKRCRVVTIQGSGDNLLTFEEALEFDKLIPNHKLHTINGANHAYTKHQAELASTVVQYVKDHVCLGRITSSL